MATHAAHVDAVVQAGSIRVNNRVYEMQEAGEDVIVLSSGEAFFNIPLFPFDTLPFPGLYHYSHSRGVPGLRRRLAAYYRDEYGVPVDPESEIIVTAGSKIALHMSFMALLEPGDEVVVPEPAWVSYSQQVRLCNAVPVMVPYDVPVAELDRWVTPNTRAIVLCSPQNPTGKVYTADELGAVRAIANDNDLYVVADEAYSDFLPEGGFVSCGADDPSKRNTLICNTMSKNYGMSGWRVGYVISNAQVIHQILKINQHLVTCPATILSHYLERHFDDILAITRPQIREVVARRRHLREFMEGVGLSCLDGDAAFYFFVDISDSALSSEEFCRRLLQESKVSIVPGIGYGESCDGFARVSVGVESVERVERGLRAIADLIEATRPKRNARVPLNVGSANG